LIRRSTQSAPKATSMPNKTRQLLNPGAKKTAKYARPKGACLTLGQLGQADSTLPATQPSSQESDVRR
jgi:hypothetical protein